MRRRIVRIIQKMTTPFLAAFFLAFTLFRLDSHAADAQIYRGEIRLEHQSFSNLALKYPVV
ncbi:MAG: hypothetical protein Q4A41_00125, partial [Bacillota bacterium]|nr:hypothetical protein [Bacillota bacterium]